METIILIISKNIHLGNPLLPTYVELQFNQFKTIVTNGYIDNELAMRNNDKIRKSFRRKLLLFYAIHQSAIVLIQ